MRAFPIFFAWVRTCRYRLRRAATPTVNRSGGASWAGVCNTTQGFLQEPDGWCVGPLQSRFSGRTLCDLTAQRRGVDEVDELLLPVDFHDRQQLTVTHLELGIAVDLDLFDLEAELALGLDDRGPCTLAEVASLRAVEADEGYG